MENYFYKNADGSEFYFADLKTVADKLSPTDWSIFEIIVSNGISEEKEAKETCISVMIAEDQKCLSSDAVWRCIQRLWMMGLFEIEKINTGYRIFDILKLTLVGEKLYMAAFRKEPPEQEHKTIASSHASYHHGYMIKDLKRILERTGNFVHIATERRENVFKLPDGKMCIPDVVAYFDETQAVAYEVECGNHHQSDIEDKCNKLTQLTHKLIFIGQNRKTVSGVLKRQISNWIWLYGREKLLRGGYKVYLASISDFAKGKWDYIFDMTSDEPICCFKKTKGGDNV